MKNKTLRILLASLQKTPFHPQWVVFRQSERNLKAIAQTVEGLVLDIGSGRQTIKPYLKEGVHYLPLDYYDSAAWYEHLPNIFADAQALPITANTVDSVLLLDVIEHLPAPKQCIMEIERVLKSRGKAIIQVPFLYPLHDEPLDFNRWTEYGLAELVRTSSLHITTIKRKGYPLETAVLLMNLAITKTILYWAEHKNPLLILAILAPFFIVASNSFAWLFSLLPAEETFMPQSYQIHLEKREAS